MLLFADVGEYNFAYADIVWSVKRGANKKKYRE